MPCLLYADDLALHAESKEDLRLMVEHFFEVCRRGLKVKANKNRLMVLGGEERLKCKIHVDRERFDQMSKLKIFGIYFG